MLENGLDICSCKRTQCERHGDCAACITHHKEHKRYAPYCIRRREKDLEKAQLKKDKELAKAQLKQEKELEKVKLKQEKDSKKAEYNSEKTSNRTTLHAEKKSIKTKHDLDNKGNED